ncbi:hypothetical protein HXX76_013320 [Chlamydomonas incerta]|uniref:Guanylate cyclase domain-containing protein n=1 Tax=Chlamydomonas incerta TaxID=51695 RepID=A0A835SEU3_CHLIN|nr:hypothetical protein HXX76_013320 [Chlamydomonas incerta]|eukprot:KAG2425947.1 hypothetical protein HXX76_013320 [Chlamydomonas incerta]
MGNRLSCFGGQSPKDGGNKTKSRRAELVPGPRAAKASSDWQALLPRHGSAGLTILDLATLAAALADVQQPIAVLCLSASPQTDGTEDAFTTDTALHSSISSIAVRTASALDVCLALRQSSEDGRTRLVFAGEPGGGGAISVGCVLTNAAAVGALQLKDEQDILCFLARQCIKDPSLKALLHDVSERLLHGSLTTVSHFVPGDFGANRYYLSLRITPFLYRRGPAAGSGAGLGGGMGGAAAADDPACSRLVAAMILELDVPYEMKALASRLQRDYAIISNIPSIVHMFDIRGRVLHQNRASVAFMGYVAGLDASTSLDTAAAASTPPPTDAEPASPIAAAASALADALLHSPRRRQLSSAALPAGGGGPGGPGAEVNWLQRLFGADRGRYLEILDALEQGMEWRGLVRMPYRMKKHLVGGGSGGAGSSVLAGGTTGYDLSSLAASVYLDEGAIGTTTATNTAMLINNTTAAMAVLSATSAAGAATPAGTDGGTATTELGDIRLSTNASGELVSPPLGGLAPDPNSPWGVPPSVILSKAAAAAAAGQVAAPGAAYPPGSSSAGVGAAERLSGSGSAGGHMPPRRSGSSSCVLVPGMGVGRLGSGLATVEEAGGSSSGSSAEKLQPGPGPGPAPQDPFRRRSYQLSPRRRPSCSPVRTDTDGQQSESMLAPGVRRASAEAIRPVAGAVGVFTAAVSPARSAASGSGAATAPPSPTPSPPALAQGPAPAQGAPPHDSAHRQQSRPRGLQGRPVERREPQEDVRVENLHAPASLSRRLLPPRVPQQEELAAPQPAHTGGAEGRTSAPAPPGASPPVSPVPAGAAAAAAALQVPAPHVRSVRTHRLFEEATAAAADAAAPPAAEGGIPTSAGTSAGAGAKPGSSGEEAPPPSPAHADRGALTHAEEVHQQKLMALVLTARTSSTAGRRRPRGPVPAASAGAAGRIGGAGAMSPAGQQLLHTSASSGSVPTAAGRAASTSDEAADGSGAGGGGSGSGGGSTPQGGGEQVPSGAQGQELERADGTATAGGGGGGGKDSGAVELGSLESRGGLGSSSNATGATNATELTVGGLIAAAVAAGSVVSGSGGGGNHLHLLSGSGGAGGGAAGVLLPAHLQQHLLPHLRTHAPVSPHRGRQLQRSGTSTPRDVMVVAGAGALMSSDQHGASTSALMMGSTEGGPGEAMEASASSTFGTRDNVEFSIEFYRSSRSTPAFNNNHNNHGGNGGNGSNGTGTGNVNGSCGGGQHPAAAGAPAGAAGPSQPQPNAQPQQQHFLSFIDEVDEKQEQEEVSFHLPKLWQAHMDASGASMAAVGSAGGGLAAGAPSALPSPFTSKRATSADRTWAYLDERPPAAPAAAGPFSPPPSLRALGMLSGGGGGGGVGGGGAGSTAAMIALPGAGSTAGAAAAAAGMLLSNASESSGTAVSKRSHTTHVPTATASASSNALASTAGTNASSNTSNANALATHPSLLQRLTSGAAPGGAAGAAGVNQSGGGGSSVGAAAPQLLAPVESPPAGSSSAVSGGRQRRRPPAASSSWIGLQQAQASAFRTAIAAFRRAATSPADDSPSPPQPGAVPPVQLLRPHLQQQQLQLQLQLLQSPQQGSQVSPPLLQHARSTHFAHQHQHLAAAVPAVRLASYSGTGAVQPLGAQGGAGSGHVRSASYMLTGSSSVNAPITSSGAVFSTGTNFLTSASNRPVSMAHTNSSAAVEEAAQRLQQQQQQQQQQAGGGAAAAVEGAAGVGAARSGGMRPPAALMMMSSSAGRLHPRPQSPTSPQQQLQQQPAQPVQRQSTPSAPLPQLSMPPQGQAAATSAAMAPSFGRTSGGMGGYSSSRATSYLRHTSHEEDRRLQLLLSALARNDNSSHNREPSGSGPRTIVVRDGAGGAATPGGSSAAATPSSAGLMQAHPQQQQQSLPLIKTTSNPEVLMQSPYTTTNAAAGGAAAVAGPEDQSSDLRMRRSSWGTEHPSKANTWDGRGSPEGWQAQQQLAAHWQQLSTVSCGQVPSSIGVASSVRDSWGGVPNFTYLMAALQPSNATATTATTATNAFASTAAALSGPAVGSTSIAADDAGRDTGPGNNRPARRAHALLHQQLQAQQAQQPQSQPQQPALPPALKSLKHPAAAASQPLLPRRDQQPPLQPPHPQQPFAVAAAAAAAVPGSTGEVLFLAAAAAAAAAEEEEMRWHEVVVKPVSDPMSEAPLILVVQTDVTSKVQAEERLARVLEAEHRLLADIFPSHVVRHMTQRRHNEAEMERKGLVLLRHIQDPAALATSHECITVLFADIKGFTDMSKEVPAATVMTFLNDLYTRFDSLTDVYGVYKVETIGDCYMVAGGLVARDEDGYGRAVRGQGDVDPLHAMRVVAFARAMLEEAANVLLPNTGEPVKMRVGIHSGPATSGVVGHKMPRFCLFGDTVNTASRMESTGRPGVIHASAATRTLLTPEEDEEGWVPTGGVDVKGKGRMDTYTWCADSEDAQRHRRGKQRRADMLGTLSSLMGPVSLTGRSRTSRSSAAAARSPLLGGRAPVVPNSKSGKRASHTANATMRTVSEFRSAPSADLP